jgi:hypothetical protein
MTENIKKDYEILCQVLEELNELSLKKWRNSKDLRDSDIRQNTRSNYEKLSIQYYPLQEKTLKKLIRESQNSLSLTIENSFYLPPLDSDNDFIPMLSFNCNLREAPPIIEMRIGMYRYNNDDNNQFQGIGFRFEKHEESNHDYYHMQLTKIPIEIQTHEYLNWMPEHIPCVLLPADNSVSLIFSMLVSFYGNRIVNIMINHMNIDSKYKEFLRYIRVGMSVTV